MKKYALLYISLFCISLFAEPEYDIILLAPEGEEFTSESDWNCTVTMNDEGFVAGAIRLESSELVPYIYHPDFGFRTFILPLEGNLEGEFDGVRGVNSHGVAVGLYSTYLDYHYESKIFVCDIVSGECFDLFDAFETDLRDRSLSRVFITDQNQVIFLTTRDFWYWYDDEDPDSLVHIYDLNGKTVELFQKGVLPM